MKLAVSTRTYNVGDPDGTFGQTISSGLFSLVIGHGTSVLPGVRDWADYSAAFQRYLGRPRRHAGATQREYTQ